MSARHVVGLSVALACAGIHGLPAQAQSLDGNAAYAVINGDAARNASGRIAVNEAAGSSSAQSNQAVIATSSAVFGVIGSRQSASIAGDVATASSTIGGAAFSGVTGLTQVNQSSGSGNLQHNAAAIVVGAVSGVEVVSDTALSGAISKGGPTGQGSTSVQIREASISPDAFRNASGIVQVNQSAGIGNVTANVFVLRPPAGTSF
ncbi:hypothetical protein PTE30175_01952 [Pandoraea terrae]|uniref:Adhesin n=1 Tax=Pandoraea terrae TaxID=1537710 RepID=A0A5E4UJ38_9BURK|nr:hypothetical protein [Pandoraea terrae]VVD98844.1 hypothetical protein PTE30175_01952 [Pandoraea terrae]